MTRAEIRAYARRLLREQATGDAFWQKADLDDYIDRAYDEVCLLTEIVQASATINSTASTMEYTLANVHHRVLRVWYKNPATAKWGEPLDRKTIRELDAIDPDWTDAIADSGALPTYFTMRGRTLLLIPAPFETQSNGIRVWSVQTPTAMTTETESPTIPTGYHEAIGIGAARRALMMRPPQNPQEASMLTAGVSALDGLFNRAVGMAKALQDRERLAGARLLDLREQL